jgi:hypothetical protein
MVVGVPNHDSCQALSNDTMGRFELSATGLSVCAVAFRVLQLSAHCSSLRSIFYLNMLALLHRCYMKRLWDMGVIVALLL